MTTKRLILIAIVIAAILVAYYLVGEEAAIVIIALWREVDRGMGRPGTTSTTTTPAKPPGPSILPMALCALGASALLACGGPQGVDELVMSEPSIDVVVNDIGVSSDAQISAKYRWLEATASLGVDYAYDGEMEVTAKTEVVLFGGLQAWLTMTCWPMEDPPRCRLCVLATDLEQICHEYPR